MPHLPSTAEPTRRHFLVMGAASTVLPGAWLSGCAQGSQADTTSVSREDAVDARARAYRLANRISWGATDLELARVKQLGIPGYIDEQLRSDPQARLPPSVQAHIDQFRIHHTPLENLVWELEASRKNATAIATEDGRRAAQQVYQQELNQLAREASSRHLLRALYSPQQLQEQLTWFWFNHFNVFAHKHNIRALVGDYEEHAIRPHVLGSFRELLGAVTHHPAMLRYLDNDQNAVARINENHARELLELHTLGVDGGYSQQDVQELARVLTGHGVNHNDNTPKLRRDLTDLYVRRGLYEFHPGRHDFGDKSVLGLRVRGRGAKELDEVLDLLARHRATAQFVSRKLAQHWLGDDPPGYLIDRMSQTWIQSGGDIASVMRVLLQSTEFSAPGSVTRKFKDPMHFVVSAVRACYGERTVLNTQPMQQWLQRMGQGLYNRQTPDGYPSLMAAWSSSGQLATRFDVARALGNGSAGLFKSDELAVARELPAFPVLTRPIYYDVIRPQLSQPTRDALDHAASPQDWNALYLMSPEFMAL